MANRTIDIHDVVSQLNEHLGPTLVATIANVRDRSLPEKWANGAQVPLPDSRERLLAALRAWSILTEYDSDDVVRAWFIGANPRLSEMSPIMRLRCGDVGAVISAAQAFAADVMDG